MKTIIKKYWHYILFFVVFSVSIGLNIYFFNVGTDASALYETEKNKFENYRDSLSEVFVIIQEEHENLTNQIVKTEEQLESKRRTEWLLNRNLRTLRATLDQISTEREALITNPNMTNEEIENYINNEYYRDSIGG